MATLRRVGSRWQQCYHLAIAIILVLALGISVHAQSGSKGRAPARSGTLASALLSSQGKVNVPKKKPIAVTAPNPGPVQTVGAPSPLPQQAVHGQQPVPRPANGSWPMASSAHYESPLPAQAQGNIAASAVVPSRSASEDRRSLPQQPFVASSQPASQPGTTKVPSALRADARLNDVFFLDAQRGWTVGDRGTICHTNDGGRSWHLQGSGVECPLHSVHFVDARNGWAVGGYTHPFTHTGTGIVLVTDDGGRTWKSKEQALLPILKKVRFFDAEHGWAIGCSSAASPTGVFHSETGGRSWNPGSRRQAAWLGQR